MNMNKFSPSWFLAMLLLALLPGCATSPGGAPEAGMPSATPDAAMKLVDSTNGEKKGAAAPVKSAEGAGAAADISKLYPGTGIFVKPAPTLPAISESGEEVMLNFDGADLREVIKIVLVDIMNESYVIDPRVQGVVNIHSSHPIKRSALLPTLESVLRMNGASLVRELDGVFHVTPLATVAKGALTPQVNEASKPLPPGYSVQIVSLKYISAREMVKILEPFTPDGGVVRVDDTRNMLFLGGNARELRHLMETIDIFDVDWIAGMSVGLFTLKSVDVKIAFSEFEKIMGDKAQSPLAGVLRIIPIERLNALLVITHQPKYLEEARVWVERLDHSGATDGGVRLYVYQVQNGDAVKMATLLGQAFSKQTSQGAAPPSLAPGLKPAEIKSPAQADTGTQPASPGSVSVSIGGATKIIADKDNNALLILANHSEYETIASAIRKLDVVPRQVLIEVTIAEVTLSDEFSFGLEWYFSNGPNRKGFLDTGATGISQLTPGFSYAWLDPAGSIKAVLNAMAANSKLNIIASPHIMVSDNHTAKIQVGDRVPTVSQTQALATAVATTATTGVISSVQYLDTGIMLSVTPHINAGGLVTMEISQEVSNAAKTVTSGIDSPTISKRSAQSTVTVQAGETMVLGGLISDKKSDSSSGLPFLSEIPLLGALFGAQNVKGDRTELVMLITPKLVANSQQAREITDEFRKKMGNVTLDSAKSPYAQTNSKMKEIEGAGQ
ncbi:MAG: type II secretion system protein GspD [Gallionellales bacterium RIFCSPLOWO2_12_FULL_59_22]|nr:MAG: type II secretion system protein GspD [Gallionellales bacterium RIFCSPLOWO2_02_58_13]OGT14407.1 MAG: type II secretion system protein GspD [Gallionellales bacterium RIFCSPLOWO2_12_FULL_59_22]